MKTIKIKPYDNFELYFTLVLCNTRKQMHTQIKKIRPKSEVLNKITTGMVSPNDYFNAACKRIEEAVKVKQSDLFVEAV